MTGSAAWAAVEAARKRVGSGQSGTPMLSRSQRSFAWSSCVPAILRFRRRRSNSSAWIVHHLGGRAPIARGQQATVRQVTDSPAYRICPPKPLPRHHFTQHAVAGCGGKKFAALATEGSRCRGGLLTGTGYPRSESRSGHQPMSASVASSRNAHLERDLKDARQGIARIDEAVPIRQPGRQSARKARWLEVER